MRRVDPRTLARPWLVLLAVLALAPALGSEAVADTEYRLGGGVHYWRTLDDLEDEGFDEIDDSGLAYVLSWQAVPGGLFKFEVDLEYFQEGFGGSTSDAISPQAYLIVGSGFYAALGGGIIYSDDFEDEFWHSSTPPASGSTWSCCRASTSTSTPTTASTPGASSTRSTPTP